MKKIAFIGVLLMSITCMNAQNWKCVGSVDCCWIYNMTEYNGDLIVSGPFNGITGIAAKNIAEWDGDKWSSLGTGIAGDDGVEAYAVYNHLLYVGGWFDSAGGIAVKHLATWDGTKWDSLKNQIPCEAVFAMDVFKGNLYVAVYVDNKKYKKSKILKWNGHRWKTIASDINGWVFKLIEYNGELYAGGDFQEIDKKKTSCIAKWDGKNWSTLGKGCMGFPLNNVILTMKVFDSALYIGGQFDSVNGIYCNHIAKWDGKIWHGLGSGLKDEVAGLTIFNNELYVGESNGHISKWDGNSWQTLAKEPGWDIYQLEVYKGNLYATGPIMFEGKRCIVMYSFQEKE